MSKQPPEFRERMKVEHELTRFNPPGQDELTCGNSTFSKVLRRMLRQIPRRIGDDSVDALPLARLNTDDEHDWTFALVEAWAMVLDVLNFYQERIVNEGYLKTAVSERSVLELARQIGYEMKPGVAASTELAFTVTKRSDEPQQTVDLPQGVAVQSVALPGEFPQIFETAAPFQARSEWNALRPLAKHDVSWLRTLRENSKRLYLAGVQTGLGPGDVIAVISRPWLVQITRQDGDSYEWLDELGRLVELPKNDVSNHGNERSDDLAPEWALVIGQSANLSQIQEVADSEASSDFMAEIVILKSLKVYESGGFTAAAWINQDKELEQKEIPGSDTGLAEGDLLLVIRPIEISPTLHNPRLIGTVEAVEIEPLRSRTIITLVNELAAQQIGRQEIGRRVIPNPQVLAFREQAALFSYSATGLFVTDLSGERVWRPAGIGLPEIPMRAFVHLRGRWFVGGEQGVYRRDEGDPIWRPLSMGLSTQDVYSLTVTAEDVLLAGTSEGHIYRSKDLGENWQTLSGESVIPFARGLRKAFPKLFAEPSLPKTVVRSLHSHKGRFGVTDFITAGTDIGIFRSTNGGRTWRPANGDLPSYDSTTGLSEVVVHDLETVNEHHLFAATDKGVFHIKSSFLVNWLIPLTGLMLAVVAVSLITLLTDVVALSMTTRFLNPSGQYLLEPTGLLISGLRRVVGIVAPSSIAGGLVLLLAPPLVLAALAALPAYEKKIPRDLRWMIAITVTFTTTALGLNALAQSQLGQPGSIGEWVTPIAQIFNSFGGFTALITMLVGLVGVCGLLALVFYRRYLSISESIDVSAYKLLKTAEGDLYVGTAYGVLQTERRRGRLWALIALGRPVRAWREINEIGQMPLFILNQEPESTSATDNERRLNMEIKTLLDERNLSRELKDRFKSLEYPLPKKAEIEGVEMGRAWRIMTAEKRTLYTICKLDRTMGEEGTELLVAYQGMATPRWIIPGAETSVLRRGDIPEGLKANWHNSKKELPEIKELHVHIISPEFSWQELFRAVFSRWNEPDPPLPDFHCQLRNSSNIPLLEIRQVGKWLIVLEPETVPAMGSDGDRLLAGTDTGAIFSYQESGETAEPDLPRWDYFDQGLTLTGSQEIALVDNQLIAIGAVAESSVEKQWTADQLKNRFIDLDRVYDRLRPNSWLALRQRHPWENRLVEVKAIKTINSRDASKPANITRLLGSWKTAPADLARFDRELTNVWVDSVPLALYDDQPVQGSTIKIAGSIPGLKAGHRVILRGKPMRAHIPVQDRLSPGLPLQAEDSPMSVDLEPGTSWPIVQRKGDKWYLETDRFTGWTAANYGQIVFEQARDDDGFKNEALRINNNPAISRDPDQTEMTFDRPLRTVYDRSTISILANVVPATHGETISDEVLGSSDGQTAHERFTLRQGPLTFLPGLTAAARSTLTVGVNGVAWHEQPFLNNQRPDAHAYIVRQDDRGQTHIIFGDGQHGAQLPANSEEITTSYRMGIGPEGNMPPNRITQLQTRLANIEAVTNPLPASGGAGRERPDQTRVHAPLRARATNRIISLSDYEDFVCNYNGISKARADLVWSETTQQQEIHIVIADDEGNEVAVESALYRNLADAIDAQRDRPLPPVQLKSFKRAFFDVSATLHINPDHSGRSEEIKAKAREALTAAFSMKARTFGEDVTIADVITVIQGADRAIMGVSHTKLGHTGSAEDHTVLEAGSLAALLMINAGQGICLSVEKIT